ncbi:hypothetical protein H2203_004193 [Taxawa tesnikishii (nom. ined.)]|nr:hypothetical protein H2203_004193 [Dothideales sp. JES 119]
MRQFVYHALKIKDTFQEIVGAERLSIRNKIMEKFEGHRLAQIGRNISEIVDFEASAERRRTVVQAGVDEELDTLKRTYDGLEHLLSKVAQHVSQRIPAALEEEANVIFFPQIGFLIAMGVDPETGSGVWEGSAEDPWEKMFTTDAMAYYKNSDMSEMDSQIGDIYGIICGKSGAAVFVRSGLTSSR